MLCTPRHDGRRRLRYVPRPATFFFFVSLLPFKGFEPGAIRERRGAVLAAGHHARVDRAHRQGGRQHGPARRGAGRARERQAHRTHHTAVGCPDQTAHTEGE